MTRMTKEHLEARCGNLNRRMESRNSSARYEIGYRNGYVTIDRTTVDGAVQAHVMSGTKGEIGDYLHVMMVALDDAALR